MDGSKEETEQNIPEGAEVGATAEEEHGQNGFIVGIPSESYIEREKIRTKTNTNQAVNKRSYQT